MAADQVLALKASKSKMHFVAYRKHSLHFFGALFSFKVQNEEDNEDSFLHPSVIR
jgi:hypothetical protein